MIYILPQKCLGDQTEKKEIGGACMVERRGVYTAFVGIPEGKIPLG
jgi:hypothetical protein